MSCAIHTALARALRVSSGKFDGLFPESLTVYKS